MQAHPVALPGGSQFDFRAFALRYYFSDYLRGKKSRKLCKKLEKRLWDAELHTWSCKLERKVGEVEKREVKLEIMAQL